MPLDGVPIVPATVTECFSRRCVAWPHVALTMSQSEFLSPGQQPVLSPLLSEIDPLSADAGSAINTMTAAETTTMTLRTMTPPRQDGLVRRKYAAKTAARERVATHRWAAGAGGWTAADRGE